MALAKDRMTSVQIRDYNEIGVGDLSTIGPPYGFGDHESHKVLIEEGDQLIKNLAMNRCSSSLGSPSSANSNEFVFRAAENQHAEEAQSLINFRAGYNNFMFANGSLLCFQQNSRDPQATSQQKGCHSTWEGSPALLQGNYHSSSNTDPRLGEEFNCFQTASNFNSMPNTTKQNDGDWLYSDGSTIANTIQESGAMDASIHKRDNMEESTQAAKKQCTSAGATKKAKPNKSAPSKDPQSIAAKNRRERISERLKVLQELVPNGSKVDLVTMLEKAISYVKFLQLQVKVLATDEFWPAPGGKAPDISQVKDAIDAILSSQRDRNSCSSSRQQ